MSNKLTYSNTVDCMVMWCTRCEDLVLYKYVFTQSSMRVPKSVLAGVFRHQELLQRYHAQQSGPDQDAQGGCDGDEEEGQPEREADV